MNHSHTFSKSAAYGSLSLFSLSNSEIIFTLFENESANVSELLESLRQEIINAINHKKTYNEEANLKRLKELDQQLQDLKKVEHEQSVALNRKQQEIRDNQDTISRLIEDLEQFRNENDLPPIDYLYLDINGIMKL